nr:MAG TPA: vesicle-associated membrane protein 2 [Caudoviricetes sp.]
MEQVKQQGSQSRKPARVASSTAKLDLLMAHNIAHNERLEVSIGRLADSVHQLAMSSARFEEKSAAQEVRLSDLERRNGDLEVTVARLEENRLTQQYWMREIAGKVLVPVVIGILMLSGWLYVKTGN